MSRSPTFQQFSKKETKVDNPLGKVKLDKKLCVNCSREKDIPGFFCSQCRDEINKSKPTIIRRKLIQEMQPGDKGYVSSECIFYVNQVLWIVGNYPIFDRPSDSHNLELIRDNEWEYVVDIGSNVPEEVFSDNWPADLSHLWITRALYWINDDDDEDGSDLTVCDLLFGEEAYVNPSALFTIDGVYHIVNYTEIFFEKTVDSYLKIFRDKENCLIFEIESINTELIPEGVPTGVTENDYEPAFFYED